MVQVWINGVLYGIRPKHEAHHWATLVTNRWSRTEATIELKEVK